MRGKLFLKKFPRITNVKQTGRTPGEGSPSFAQEPSCAKFTHSCACRRQRDFAVCGRRFKAPSRLRYPALPAVRDAPCQSPTAALRFARFIRHRRRGQPHPAPLSKTLIWRKTSLAQETNLALFSIGMLPFELVTHSNYLSLSRLRRQLPRQREPRFELIQRKYKRDVK